MESQPSPTSLAIPPDLLAKIQAAAEEAHRSAGDMLRDVIERGLNAGAWQAHVAKEYQRAHEVGILEQGDGKPITDEYRQVIREKIARGVHSLREGRMTDGAAFMARMDAELAELERQGQ
jgi:hypothetical protein